MSLDATAVAAWWGAGIGTAVFLWDVVKWKHTRPRLVVKTNFGMRAVSNHSGEQPGRFAVVTVVNRGEGSTTISGLSAHCYRSQWQRCRKNAEHAFLLIVETAQPLPHKLESGAQWSGYFPENEEIAELARDGIVEIWVTASHKNRPVRSRVKTIHQQEPGDSPGDKSEDADGPDSNTEA